MAEDQVEVIETEEDVELAPENRGLVLKEGYQAQGAEDIFWLADNAERLIEARKTITKALLKLAKPGDWVSFSSDSDKDGTATIDYAGSMRIAANFGVSFVDRKVKKILGRDSIGSWYRYESEVTCIFRNTQVRTWGRAGSRDPFFGKAAGSWKALEDVNEGNVKMAAIRGAMKEGVRVLLGLHRFPIRDLVEMGISVDFTKGHHFTSKPTPTVAGEASKPAETPEKDEELRNKVRGMLLEMCNDDTRKAGDMLEEFTGFTGKDGTAVKGKRTVEYLSGTRLSITYSKIKNAYKTQFGRDFSISEQVGN